MIVYKCDICGCEIPIVKKQFFGIEKEVLDRGKIECEQLSWSVMPFLNLDICKRCASELSAKIDYELLKLKTECLGNEN